MTAIEIALRALAAITAVFVLKKIWNACRTGYIISGGYFAGDKIVWREHPVLFIFSFSLHLVALGCLIWWAAFR